MSFVLDAFAHEDLPFDQLVEELQPDRVPGRTPLVQLLVVLHNAMIRPRHAAGLRITEEALPRPAARFDVVVEFWPVDDSLQLLIEYNAELFEAATIERMAAHLTMLLDALATDPRRRIRDLPALAAAGSKGSTHGPRQGFSSSP